MINLLIWNKCAISDSNYFKEKKKRKEKKSKGKQKTFTPCKTAKNLPAQLKMSCNEIAFWNAVKYWLNAVIISYSRFRLNLHSIVAWMSKNYLLKTCAISDI